MRYSLRDLMWTIMLSGLGIGCWRLAMLDRSPSIDDLDVVGAMLGGTALVGAGVGVVFRRKAFLAIVAMLVVVLFIMPALLDVRS